MEATETKTTKKFSLAKGFAIFLVIFGLLTLKSGGSVLFIDAVKENAGDFVLFIVWYNVIIGVFHLIVASGIWFGKVWSHYVALVVFLGYLVVDAFFVLHIMNDGVYMQKTIAAMIFRTAIWAIATFVVTRNLAHKGEA